MLAYIAKGGTAGHIILRAILRNVTGLPGFVIDCFCALFYAPDFMSYWAEDSGWTNMGHSTITTIKTHSVWYGSLSWIGEVAGYAIGVPVGYLLGAALYFPDMLLRGFIALHKMINDSLNDFAAYIGKTVLFSELGAYENPKNYLEKAWNLGMVVLGTVIGVVPYILAKIVAFVFPILDVSDQVKVGAAYLGAFIGGSVAVSLFLPVYVLEKFTELLSIFRDTVRSGVALIYACGGEDAHAEGSVLHAPAGTIEHSTAFVNKIKEYERSTWAKLIFGPLSEGKPQETSKLVSEASGDFHPPLLTQPNAPVLEQNNQESLYPQIT